MKKRWKIYSLLDESGRPFYVGKTHNLKARLWEHEHRGGPNRTPLGFRPGHIVLQSGTGNWRPVEAKWIKLYLARGFKLRNTYWSQGAGMMPERTKAKLRQAFTGRPCTWGAKISAAQKGIQKNWSKAGLARQKRTRFKPGHRPSAKSIRESLKANRKMWAEIPKKLRSAMATQRNLQVWAKRSPRKRRMIGRNIRAGQIAIGPKKLKQIARKGGMATYGKNPRIASRNAKSFWIELRKDPKRFQEYITRRAKSIRKAKRAVISK